MKITTGFICVHCGEIALDYFTEIDSGSTLTCSKCKGETIVLLCKPVEYREIVNARAEKKRHEKHEAMV